MSILSNISRSIFLVFLLSISSIACGNNSLNSFDNQEVSNPLSEDILLSQHIKNESIAKSTCKKYKIQSYYLYISDFISSFIEIPTSNVLIDSSTIASSYLAGRAPVYNTQNEKVGTCSASFLNMQTADGIFTDISNYLSVDNGLVISWFTPSTLLNLELDSVIHGMVTECIVYANTKIGFNPFYGQKFNMFVSSDGQKIYFKLYQL